MCEYIDTIQDVVSEFVEDERTFSAFDVTKQVRIVEKGSVNVEHNVVRGAVHAMMSGMDNYQAAFNGKYQEYQPVATQPALVQDSGSYAGMPPAPSPFNDSIIELLPGERLEIEFQEPLSKITISQG